VARYGAAGSARCSGERPATGPGDEVVGRAGVDGIMGGGEWRAEPACLPPGGAGAGAGERRRAAVRGKTGRRQVRSMDVGIECGGGIGVGGGVAIHVSVESETGAGTPGRWCCGANGVKFRRLDEWWKFSIEPIQWLDRYA
jgi:hypothetical protein